MVCKYYVILLVIKGEIPCMGTSPARAHARFNQSESKSKAHQRALFRLRKSSAAQDLLEKDLSFCF